MSRRVRKLLGIAALSCSACAATQPDRADFAVPLASLGGPGHPGCVAGVYRDGRLARVAAAGAADLEGRLPLTSRTVFNVASVSKQFTAFGVLLLEHHGALSLDDSITKHVPELGTPARPATLRHLLHHTGGLRDYVGLLQLEGYRFTEPTTREQALQALARQRSVNASAGTAYEYSNTGYFLLGVAIERVSGQPLRQFLRERVFEPLGMTSTTLVDRYPAAIAGLARGYSPVGEGFALDESPWEQTGDGQVHTSIEDLARWERNLLTGELGGPEVLRRMLEPGRLASGRRIEYAAGLALGEYRGLPTVGHGGDWAGYTAHVLRFPQERFAAAVLCNRSDVRPARYTAAIAERELGERMRGPIEPRALAALRARGGGVSPAALPPGLYRNVDTGAYLRLSLDAAGPRLHSGRSASPLEESAPGVFHVPQLGRTYAMFLRSGAGRPARIIVQDSPQVQVYEHAAPWRPPRLDALAGGYWSDEANARIELVVRAGGLVLLAADGAFPLHPMAESELEGHGLLGADVPFTLRFSGRGAQREFLLFTEGLRGLRFEREP